MLINLDKMMDDAQNESNGNIKLAVLEEKNFLGYDAGQLVNRY